MVTNEWKFEVWHGQADDIEEWCKAIDSQVEKDTEFDWSEDEIWFEKKPKREFPSDFIFSPIVVQCVKREQGEQYQESYEGLTIETPFKEREG